MGELENSVQRHPAGNARKETIWDTAWAISKAMQVGRDDERERIIKLIEFNRQYMIDSRKAGQVDILLAEERYARLIALIKEENK
jgi:hypothetical protein